MKNAKNGLFSIMALILMFLPQITTGMNSTILQTQEAAKHPHCIRNTAFAKAQHRRNRGGICGKTYGNGFDAFSCCNRQFTISSIGLFIILSSANPLRAVLPSQCLDKVSRPYEIFNRFYANFHIGKRKVFFNRRLAATLHMGKFLYSGILWIIGIIILFIFCSAMQAKADCQPFPIQFTSS